MGFEKELSNKLRGTTITEEFGITLDEESQSEVALALMQQDSEKQFSIRVLKKNILKNIQNSGNYRDSEILDAIDKVLRVSSNKGKSEEELTTLVWQKLNPPIRSKKRRRKIIPSRQIVCENTLWVLLLPHRIKLNP